MSAWLRSVLGLSAASLAFGALAGCSTLQVKVERPPKRVIATTSAVVAEARESWSGAAVGTSESLAAYNAAVGDLVDRFAAGESLAIRRSGTGVIDPSPADRIIPAARVQVRRLHARSASAGVGVPVVLWFDRENPVVRDEPGMNRTGLALPATAVFDPRRNELVFYDTLTVSSARIRGREVRLATDFSAPLAYLIHKGPNRSIDIGSMIFTARNADRALLLQLQPFDPNKIPVVFVHGLLSRPEAWTQATNTLLADPEIRKRYQFWYFLYPTGLPVWRSAAILRSDLDRFRRTIDPKGTNANLQRMVLVGHSMGGLISSLMIREGGDHLWKQFSDRDFESLNLDPAAREDLRRMIVFAPRKDVERVIFVATPHRGSPMALRPIAGFAAQLIQLPFAEVSRSREYILQALRDDARSILVAPANSLRFLRANSPLVLSILNLPLSRRVAVHSIIGDRGRGDSPDSTDGVVPYWSSHLEGAISEKIVPSGHGANEHHEGIEEIRRILKDPAGRAH